MYKLAVRRDQNYLRIRNPNRLARILALASLAVIASLPQALAVDPTNIFYGTGAGNGTLTGFYNAGFGYNALHALTSGSQNVAVGDYALDSNTGGNSNTAIGMQALTNTINGGANTACGAFALNNNTAGQFNVATGVEALYYNTTASFNVATGSYALFVNSGGAFNTATGHSALYSNQNGSSNTATGYQALYSNTTGSQNLAAGYQALYGNTTGHNNMATGSTALYANTTGNYNMANGPFALVHNTTGNYNVGEGINALFNNTTGSGNIGLGIAGGSNLTTGNNNIDIGNRGVAGESATIRIGSIQVRTYISGIRNAAVSGGMPVSVSSTGQLGISPSSRRFKQEIADMGDQSDAILKLHPVSFHYKEAIDPNKVAQFGLIAEEVAKVNPNLVVRDDKGEVYSVRYEAINAMLLNEFLKEHTRNEQQQRQIAELTQAVKEQADQLQRVSAQLAVQSNRKQPVATK